MKCHRANISISSRSSVILADTIHMRYSPRTPGLNRSNIIIIVIIIIIISLFIVDKIVKYWENAIKIALK